MSRRRIIITLISILIVGTLMQTCSILSDIAGGSQPTVATPPPITPLQCLEQGAEQLSNCTKNCQANSAHFLLLCLEQSQPSPDFCSQYQKPQALNMQICTPYELTEDQCVFIQHISASYCTPLVETPSQ